MEDTRVESWEDEDNDRLIEEVPVDQADTSTNRRNERAEVIGTLNLRGGSGTDAHVRWDENVIDNENLDRAKSKICCIFHPDEPEEYEEGDDTHSEDSDGPNAYERPVRFRKKS